MTRRHHAAARLVLGGLAFGAVALLGVTDPAAGQQRPDFSGAWTTAPQEDGGRAGRGGRGGRGQLPATLGTGWGPQFEIVQSADTLMVEREFFSRGDMQRPIRFRLALDGSETRNTVLMGRSDQASTSTVAWQNDRLSITTVQVVENPVDGSSIRTEVTRTLWLEGTSLMIETVRAGVLGGPSSTTRTEHVRAG